MADSTEALTDGRSAVQIRGAREHNLRSLDVDIPLGELVVITGVSGSGKTSLAVPVLAAAGQRRVLEGMAPAVRRQFERWRPPLVNSLAHVPPPVLVRWEHSQNQRDPQATVATLLDLEEPLVDLFRDFGRLQCPDCGQPIVRQTPERIAAEWTGGAVRQRAMIGFPLSAELRRAGPQSLVQQGCVRLWNQREILELTQLPRFPRGIQGEVIVDRLTTDRTSSDRWRESLEFAWRMGGGTCSVLIPAVTDSEVPSSTEAASWQVMRYSHKLNCAACERSLPDPSTLTWRSAAAIGHDAWWWRELSLERVGRLTLRELATAFSGSSVTEVKMPKPPTAAASAARAVAAGPSTRATNLLEMLCQRLAGATELGMGHLSLRRAVGSLSAGECRRLLLVNAVSRDLPETLLIFDEPASGLHPSEMPALLRWLRVPLARRQSVVVIEHAPEIVTAADTLLELGPGAGEQGGQLVAYGSVAQLLSQTATVTAAAWQQRRQLQFGDESVADRREPAADWLFVTGLHGRCFHRLNLRLPLQRLTVVTGIAGSGKTSLVGAALPQFLRASTSRSPTNSASENREPLEFQCEDFQVDAPLDCVVVTALPLSSSVISTVVTRLQIFDEIRQVFAETADARRKGWKASQFSFASSQGLRCPHCRGRGTSRLELGWIPDAVVTCPDCGGTRYRSEIREVRYRGLSLVDVLEMTVAAALPLFHQRPALYSSLSTMVELGLGYLVLGQPASVLSGGEAQRIRLASQLTARTSAARLIFCDEPTAGIHPTEINRLTRCFRRLTELGNTVVVADQSPELLAAADWILELDCAGDQSSTVLRAHGTPSDLRANPESLTGELFRQLAPSNPRL